MRALVFLEPRKQESRALSEHLVNFVSSFSGIFSLPFRKLLGPSKPSPFLSSLVKPFTEQHRWHR